MADAIVVSEVFKKFGRPAEQSWRRLLPIKPGTNGHESHIDELATGH
ncbi:MAG: hypothetical protein JXB07_04305 [Anaerolineae bacterium]|nr:hypothetical protein [Anaerolineae bacterium]